MQFNGKIIKDLRKASGETQEDIASAIGTSSPLISQWETGARTPSTPMLLHLAKHFGVSIDALFKEA